MSYFFLLGAEDPEMKKMEELLGDSLQYAVLDGKRVHPDSAYDADPVVVPRQHQLVLIECEPSNIREHPDAIRLDHHRPGDPGYNKGAQDFLKASSIGQLHQLLDVEPTAEVLVVAACDHCMPDAVQGRCPGVSPEEALAFSISEIARHTHTSSMEVSEHIKRFQMLIENAPREVFGEQEVHDLREHYLDPGYSLNFLTARVAVALEGCCALLCHDDWHRGGIKWQLFGNAAPETFVLFQGWAVKQGLKRVYGVPHRGYAGGYL
ncbi:hypothetical protein KTR10_02130 [Candidatus Kaiserbacteria bacterium]|nr:hypothetical protein [Candidatus Kaiserbacteria bacterium]